MELREPEDSHDRVADVLLDSAAVSLQYRPHLLEVDVEYLAQRLRVELLSQVRGALEIAEDDRHGLTHLFGGGLHGELCPAHPADFEAVRILFTAAWTDLHGRSLRRALGSLFAM